MELKWLNNVPPLKFDIWGCMLDDGYTKMKREWGTTSIEGTESPRHISLSEAIKEEKIKNEWTFPFQGGLLSQDYFHLTVEGGGSGYEMEISIHF